MGIDTGKINKDEYFEKDQHERDWTVFKAIECLTAAVQVTKEIIVAQKEETHQIIIDQKRHCNRRYMPMWVRWLIIPAFVLVFILISIGFQHPETTAKVSGAIVNKLPVR